MEYPPPPPVPSDVDPATLAAHPLEELAGAQQAELMAAIKALGDGGDFPEARVQELTQAHERAALPERDTCHMLLKYTIPQLNIIGCGVFGAGPGMASGDITGVLSASNKPDTVDALITLHELRLARDHARAQARFEAASEAAAQYQDELAAYDGAA